jgi:hypothetical protein
MEHCFMEHYFMEPEGTLVWKQQSAIGPSAKPVESNTLQQSACSVLSQVISYLVDLYFS